ncbi:MAG: transglutaminaseTgpA domain-containing protein, partial [Desulfobacterales bacterium]|nr:transglutaminaseTgpA domain-containing protein [Desulfobacterales bacterium]
MMEKSTPRDPMGRDRPRHIIPIIFALVVAIAPHVPDLPPWITLWCLVMWGYMLLHLKTGWPLPGPWLCRSLGILGILGVFFTFQVRLDGDAFVGLLAAMAAVKPFEMPNHRHRIIAILLTYFIVVTSLFRWESLWAFFHLFLSVFVTTVALVRINHPQGLF